MSLIIGSKPYKISLNNIIDLFEPIRCNISIQNNNNGTKYGSKHVINCHLFDKYNNKSNIYSYISTYGSFTTTEYIQKYLNYLETAKPNMLFFQNNNTELMQEILKKINSNIIINKQIRVGYGMIAENIKNQIFSYIIGFSINNEILNTNETSFYCTVDDIFSNKCHNINIEIKLLQELHIHNLIDCTFCLLDNLYELPLLNCKFIKPTKDCIYLLLAEYGICILENYYDDETINNIISEYDRIFNNHQNNIEILDAEDCSKDERIFHAEKYSNIIKDKFSDNILLNNIAYLYTNKQFNKKTLINRLEYSNTETRNSGAGWHRDNHDCQFKTIMYLTDVTDKNGCFQFITNSSKKYIGYPTPRTENYNTRYSDETINNIINTNNNTKKYDICGKKGTIIIVDTTYIHRGKNIEEGLRKAITQYYF